MNKPFIDRSHVLTRRSALCLVAAALIVPQPSAIAQTSSILVHKDPNCGCCTGWVQHLRAAGFAVAVTETHRISQVRQEHGLECRRISPLAIPPRSRGLFWINT